VRGFQVDCSRAALRFIRARLSGGLQPRVRFCGGLPPCSCLLGKLFRFCLARGSARAWAFRKLQIGAGVPVVEVVRSFPGKPVAILSQ